MTARKSHMGITFYQCVNNTSDAPNRCKSPGIDIRRMDHDLFSQVAFTLNDPVPQEVAALPKFHITDADIDNIFPQAADPQHYKTAILPFALHPETYTRPDFIQQTRAARTKVVDHITVREDDVVIHYANPSPDSKLRLGGYCSIATPRSETY